MTGRSPDVITEWRWVDIGGAQHKVRQDDLVAALRRARLPPHVLVWRSGWGEWLPAANVGELRHAFTAEQSGPAASVRVDDSIVSPPPPPLGHYTLKVPRGTLTLERPGTSSTPPRPENRAKPPLGIPNPSRPAPVPMRNVLPTLSEEEGQPPRSNTLRPMGALPPPPRAIAPPKRPPFSGIPPVGQRPVIPPLSNPPRTPVPPDPAENLPVAASRESPTTSAPPPPSARARAQREQASPPVASGTPAEAPLIPSPVGQASADTPVERAASPPARAPRERADGIGGVSRKTVAIATCAALLIPSTVVFTLALRKPPRKPGNDATLSAVSASAGPAHPSAIAAAPEPSPGCVIDKPARRLAEAAYLAVPTLVSAAPDGHTAIGFAATKEHAVGLSLEPETLETTVAFEQTVSGSTTLGVVPLVRSGRLEFTIDRADPKFASARTIDAPQRFTIGATDEGISRMVGTVTNVVWAREAEGAITTPRVASIPAKGHVIVFRRGGQEGRLAGGWLTDDGTKSTELRTIKAEGTLVGTPAIAASNAQVLVAFAAKLTATDGWRLELATAPNPIIPERSSPFTLPESGPGGEAISPAVEALDSGRFLLQWTEGSAGNRAVRAQVLSSDLVRVGDPVTLSSSDQNAGQGALFAQGKHVLALFLVQKESGHELWGASLTCQ
jgi:hypothetical protein